MAVIAPTRDSLTSGHGVGMRWALANGDSGTPWDTVDYPDWSVQVSGTFGAGGTILLEGSNDTTPSVWNTLTDPAGAALSFTAAGLMQALQLTRWVRPRVSAGDGTTALVAQIYAGRRR